MDSSHQSQPPRSRTTAQWEAVHAITDSVGRRGVRIYGLSREQLGAVVFTIIFVGIPLFFFLSMLPVWDHVGELQWVSRVNTYIAPAINSLDNSYRAEAFPRLPLKRFVIAAEIITVLLFWINFASLFFRKIRKHALLVWICFDRSKILFYLFVSGLVVISQWYILFYDWSVLHLISLHAPNSIRHPGARVIMWVVMSVPSITLLFGHLTAIVILGICHTTLRELRSHRVYSVAGSAREITHVVGETKRKVRAQITIMQCIGFAIIGIVFIAALKILVSSIHQPSSTVAAPSDSMSPSIDILSDHGPKRVSCDHKWLDQPKTTSYEDFLRRCMSALP